MLKIASASEVTFYLSCVFYTRYPPKSKKKKKAAKQSTDIYDQSSRCSVPHHKWESVAWLRQPYGLWERYMCVLCVCWLECSRQTFMCGECWSPLGRRIHNIDLVHGMLCGVYVRLGWPPNIYIYACASAKRKSSFSLPSKVLINGRAGGILYSTPMIDRVDWNRSQRVRPTQWRNVAAKLESQHNAKLLLSRCCCRFIVVVWKLHYVIDNWRTVIIVDRINDQTDFNLRRSAFHRRPRPLLACITDIARRTYERYICWNRANGRLRH